MLRLLSPRGKGLTVDCTLGLGGHAEAILQCPEYDGHLLGLDRDSCAIERACARLGRFGQRFTARQAAFSSMDSVLVEMGLPAPEFVLFDLGASSMQFDDALRGFSFRQDGPLDMRMDQRAGPTAADLVNGLDEPALADLIRRYGEEHRAGRIARIIVRERQREPITSTSRLAGIVREAVGRPRDRLDQATRTFQALRIAVNDELGELEKGLAAAMASAAPGGGMAVISFHSLEDRIVKRFLRTLALQGRVDILTRRPVRPTDEEVAANPRARSARLRCARILHAAGEL